MTTTRVRLLTDIGADRTALVIRVVGAIRGVNPHLDYDAVLEATTGASLFPLQLPGVHRNELEADLRSIAEASGPDYFEACARQINVLAERISDGVRRDEIRRLAVFGFARIPLLIHLGHASTTRCRRTSSSGSAPTPPTRGAGRTQPASRRRSSADFGSEAFGALVLIVNLSGSIGPDELPAAVLGDSTIYELQPAAPGAQRPGRHRQPGGTGGLRGCRPPFPGRRRTAARQAGAHRLVRSRAGIRRGDPRPSAHAQRLAGLEGLRPRSGRQVLPEPGGPGMRFVDDFESFLRSEVNLNQTRLDRLQNSVNAIENFLAGQATFAPLFLDMVPAGSWAHRTIIKPVGEFDGFDGDVLLYVKENADWQPKDYIEQLYAAFHDSDTYRTKAQGPRCVRIDYAGDFHVDVVPYLERYGSHYITNRLEPQDEGRFEASDPEAFSAWIDERQRASNGSFVKVVRLLKYLRDYKNTFSCKSIILTTLLGNELNPVIADLQPESYKDVPTTLNTPPAGAREVTPSDHAGGHGPGRHRRQLHRPL